MMGWHFCGDFDRTRRSHQERHVILCRLSKGAQLRSGKGAFAAPGDNNLDMPTTFDDFEPFARVFSVALLLVSTEGSVLAANLAAVELFKLPGPRPQGVKLSVP